MSRAAAPRLHSWSPPATWPGPEPGNVDVWRIPLDRASASEAVLTDEERRRAARLRIDHKRRQYVTSRAALRSVLGRYLDRDPVALDLHLGRNGKPELPGSGLSFNLSHSGSLALLAVTPTEVALGVDVEEVAVERAHDRLARRFFSTPETEAYALVPAPDRVAAFYRLWTRKEAYLKAWGTGLTFSSRRFTLDLGPGSGNLLVSTEMPGDEQPGGWWFESLDPGPGFVATACWQGARATVRRFDFG